MKEKTRWEHVPGETIDIRDFKFGYRLFGLSNAGGIWETYGWEIAFVDTGDCCGEQICHSCAEAVTREVIEWSEKNQHHPLNMIAIYTWKMGKEIKSELYPDWLKRVHKELHPDWVERSKA